MRMSLLMNHLYRFSINKTIYVNGKSTLSLSHMIGGNRKYIDPLMNNFYIYEHPVNNCDTTKENEEKLLKSVITNEQIVRCILSLQISKKEMNLNINSLKKNPLLNYLIQLQEDHKYKLNTPQIIIVLFCISQNSKIPNHEEGKVKSQENSETVDVLYSSLKGQTYKKQEMLEFMNRNLIEIEKLFVDGLSLNASYMLSKDNLHRKLSLTESKESKNFWIESLSKKSKAIHSNVVQKGLKFEDIVYEQGYKLHHIFLSSYDSKSQKLALLKNNQAYKIKQIVYIMGMINFNGKLVLDCQQPDSGSQNEFMQNIAYLDKILKENGYKQTQIDNLDDQSYISIF